MKRSAQYHLLGVLLIAGAAAWSGYAALANAPVIDESPHLAAGISYVQLLDYRLNPEHPPLEKLAAGLMVSAFSDPILPTDASWWPNGINEQWRTGTTVLWGGANNPAEILALGRIGVLLLNLVLLFIGWRAAARRFGEGWGLGFLGLLAASPFFLGHAHLITTDVTAAAMTMIACFAFAHFMQRPTYGTGVISAVAFGGAQLAKFSLVLLIPTFLIVAGIIAWRKYGASWRPIFRELGKTVAVIAAGFLLVVYPTYLVLTWNQTSHKAVTDARFLLGSFAGGSTESIVCNPLRCVADVVIAAQGNSTTRPAATYALGVLMVIQRSAGGNTIFFDGVVSSSGSTAYFPLLYATKETIPALVIVLAGLFFSVQAMRNSWRNVGRVATPELVLGVFSLLYIASTLRSSLNIGIRHIFPLIPIAYFFAITAWRNRATTHPQAARIFVALVVAQTVTGITSLPYPLSYFNALAGGTKDGYTIAADSNYDWGQDVIRLRSWIDAHPEAGRIAVDLFSGSDSRAVLGERAIPWWSAQGDPSAYGISWIAISSNVVLNSIGPVVPGQVRPGIDEYQWLSRLRGTQYGEIPEPDERIGTSIFLYRLR